MSRFSFCLCEHGLRFEQICYGWLTTFKQGSHGLLYDGKGIIFPAPAALDDRAALRAHHFFVWSVCNSNPA
jgi:hypothetical protein